MTITSYSPSHSVIIKSLATGKFLHDLSRDVLNINTSKSYGRGTGGWSITTTSNFANSKDWQEVLQPNNIVEIRLCSGATGSPTVVVMRGLIDRISYSRLVTEDGLPHRTIKITGSDMGKLLASEVGWDINASQMQVAGTKQIMVNLLRRFHLTIGTPAGLVKQLLDIVAEDTFTIPINIEWERWITSTDNWKLFNEEAYLLEQTTIWQALKRFENAPWNILYCDTDDDGVFRVGLEEYPLDHDGMPNHGSLKTLSLTDADLVSEDISRSDSERVTLMALHTPISTYVAKESAIDFTLARKETTKLSPEEIRVHGFTPQIFKTDFMPPSFLSKDHQLTTMGDIESRVNVMWNWVKKNHTYYSGIVTIHGTPEVRAGWKMTHKEHNRAYLIEQVSHQYVSGNLPRFLTTLSVTRGQGMGAQYA